MKKKPKDKAQELGITPSSFCYLITTNGDLTIENEYQIQLQFDTHLGLHFFTFCTPKLNYLQRKGLPFI